MGSADFMIVDQNFLALADEGRPEKIGATKVSGDLVRGQKVTHRDFRRASDR